MRRTWLSDAACVEYLVDLIYKPVVHVLLSIKIRLLFIMNHRKATKIFLFLVALKIICTFLKKLLITKPNNWLWFTGKIYHFYNFQLAARSLALMNIE